MKWRKKETVYLPSSTKRYAPLMVICAGVLFILPLITDHTYYLGLGCLIMIYSTLAMSVDLLSGYMGLSSLGQAGFFGFAAYAAGYFSATMGISHLVSIVLSLLCTTLLAMVFGLVTNKAWGNTFMMVSMALGLCIWGLAYKMTTVTGGEMGLLGITRPEFFGIKFTKITPFFYLTFTVFVLVMLFVYKYVNSPFGLTIKGIKQSPVRMSALGFDIYRHKYIAYVISGVLAGIAGIMYCFYMRFVSPTDCNTVMSSKAFLMAMVGGAGTLGGSIIGATIIVILENVISSYTERWTMVMGLLYIITVMASPGGIIGFYNAVKFKRKTRKAAALNLKKTEERDADTGNM